MKCHHSWRLGRWFFYQGEVVGNFYFQTNLNSIHSTSLLYIPSLLSWKKNWACKVFWKNWPSVYMTLAAGTCCEALKHNNQILKFCICMKTCTKKVHSSEIVSLLDEYVSSFFFCRFYSGKWPSQVKKHICFL